MTDLQEKIINLCIRELEETLGEIPTNEADDKVTEVVKVLRFLLEVDEE